MPTPLPPSREHNRLYFLRVLRRNDTKEADDVFLPGNHHCISVWDEGCSAVDKKALQRVVE